jgi:hypothetical protein
VHQWLTRTAQKVQLDVSSGGRRFRRSKAPWLALIGCKGALAR